LLFVFGDVIIYIVHLSRTNFMSWIFFHITYLIFGFISDGESPGKFNPFGGSNINPYPQVSTKSNTIPNYIPIATVDTIINRTQKLLLPAVMLQNLVLSYPPTNSQGKVPSKEKIQRLHHRTFLSPRLLHLPQKT